MPYGIIKVDTITFTDGGADKTVSISGLVQNPTFSGNITVTGTISGNVIRGGTTVSGATVTGTAGQFGTLTGNTAGFTTITGATVTGTVAQFTTITGGTAGFTTVTGATVTGTTANFTTLSGTTVTGNAGSFTTVTGGVATITSGVFAVGAEALPSISFASDPNTGIYSPGADQVAISTNGTGRLFVDASGNVGVGTAPSQLFHIAGASATALLAASSGVGTLRLTRGATTADLSVSTALATLATTSATDFAFSTNNTERLRITSTGALNFVGAGTAGSTQAVSFNGSAPVNSLVIDSSGRLGVGTSSPSSALDVSGAISLGAVAIPSAGTARIFSRNTDSNLYIQTGSGNALNLLDGSQNTMATFGSSTVTLQTGNSPRLSIDSSGRVGIGTASPGALFDLAANNDGATGTTANNTFRFTDLDTNTAADQPIGKIEWYSADTSSPGARAVSYILSAAAGLNSGGDIRFGVSANAGSASEAARIDSSGRLLVGTSTARANFFNAGATAQVQIEGTDADKSAIASINVANTAGGGRIYLAKGRGGAIGSNTVVQNGDTLGIITFQGNDGTEFVEGANIEVAVDGTPGANDMPGRLVFSTTADGASSPTERMRIANNGESYITSTGLCLGLSSVAAAGTTTPFIDGRYGATAGTPASGTQSFRVWTNGNVQNTNNSYTAISDIKLKENIVDANSQWADLKALRVRNYNLKEGQTHRQIGLIAQEVEPISPGLVYESPDRDEDGNDLGTVTKSVNYSVLYMKAVKALQEAMERIEVLEQRLSDAGIA